jgi:TonB family protein
MPATSSYLDCSTSPADRRVHLRQAVRSLAYVELGEGNGGIALNISEGGMAVQAVMSVMETELPAMRVQLAHSKKQIQAKGRIAWTTGLGKLAGVEFVDLSEEARQQIREWVSLEAPAQDSAVATTKSDGEEAVAFDSKLVGSVTAGPDPVKSAVRVDLNRRPIVMPETPDSRPPENQLRPTPAVVPAALVQPAFVPTTSAFITPTPVTKATETVPPAIAAVRVTEPREPQGEVRVRETPPAAPTAVIANSAVPLRRPVAPSVEQVRAPFSTRDPAPLPADRFGFKPIERPKPLLNVVAQHSPPKWGLNTWAGIFLIVSLAAGLVAGHGALHGIFQKSPGSPVDTDIAAEEVVTTGGSSPNTSEIEAVDLNGQRWLIPMQGPLGSTAGSGSLESASSPGSAENRMNLGEWTLSAPVHSQSATAETKTTPPVLPSASNDTDNILPTSGTTDFREAIPAPPVGASRPSSDLQPGQLIQKVEPVYPAALMEQKIEGTVTLFAVIDEEGNIKSVHSLSGPRLLYQPAIDAVRQWHYSPTLLNGHAVETERQITMVFQLKE